MAYSSSSSNANSKVHTCSTECEKSYAQLKKLYDTQREQLGDASIEIQAYTQALKNIEAQLVAHQKNQLCANDKDGFGHNGAKDSKVSETITSVSKAETSNYETSNDKVEMPKIETVRMSEPIIEEWESDSEDDEIVVKPKEVTKTVKPSFEKIESVNARNETVRQAENSRKNNKGPRGNKRNWNGMITQKLGDNFEFKNKTCYVCGSFDHLHYTCKHKRQLNNQKQVKPVWNNSKRVNHQNFGIFSHPNPKGNIVPQAVLTKSGLVSLNTVRPVNTAQPRKTMNDDMPTAYSYYKAYSSVKRPFNKKIANYNRYFNKRVNTVKSTRVNTARPKAEVNTVKASASWVWKPKHEELDHVFKSNSASKTLTRYDYVDALEKLKLLCVTRVNFGLLNCHSEVAVWIPLKLLLLKIVLEGVSDKQRLASGYNRKIMALVKKVRVRSISQCVNTARYMMLLFDFGIDLLWYTDMILMLPAVNTARFIPSSLILLDLFGVSTASCTLDI
ncbi:hypothetical protein Tco_0931881 [Tanacetum coccineum]